MRIAVIGAGVAGSTLAYRLRQAGHAPTLYARDRRTDRAVIELGGAGWTVAERMGLLPRLRAIGEETGPNALRLRRSDLVAALLGQSVVRTGDAVVGLRDGPRGIRVDFASGTTREFDLVVGADGVDSPIRELRFGLTGEHPLGYTITTAELPGRRAPEVRAGLTRRVERVPFGASTVFRVATPDGADPREVFADDPEVAAALDAPTWSAPVRQIRLPRWSDGSVVLLGDAAGCVGIGVGDGTGLAMGAAHVLAAELARATVEEALARYEERVRPVVERRQAAIEANPPFAVRSAVGAWVRERWRSLRAGPPQLDDLVLT